MAEASETAAISKNKATSLSRSVRLSRLEKTRPSWIRLESGTPKGCPKSPLARRATA
jgi:hypothetical protein